MGVELVEGRDLFSTTASVFMRTTRGLQRVDVLYRRVDDDFLDPLAFRRDSQLGVAGLIGAYRRRQRRPGQRHRHRRRRRQGHLPVRARHHPLLPRARSRSCPTSRRSVRWCPRTGSTSWRNLDKLVVKAVDGSGGYGMLIGPASTGGAARRVRRARSRPNPRGYIAQPTITLSQHPTCVDGRLEGRHVDLRPFVLYGEEITVLPGGLTRVALPRGSLVVNSSQGGGSKDTWVLR